MVQNVWDLYLLSNLPGVKMLLINIGICWKHQISVGWLRTLTFRVLHVQPRRTVFQFSDTSRMGWLDNYWTLSINIFKSWEKPWKKPLKAVGLPLNQLNCNIDAQQFPTLPRWAAASSERSGLGSSLWGRRFRPANVRMMQWQQLSKAFLAKGNGSSRLSHLTRQIKMVTSY